MWKLYAVLSAVFASLTAIFAKIGIKDVNSNLATAIRTVVILIMAWGIVFIAGTQKGISSISKHSWLFLILSGLATGCSWLFYFKAIQIGEVSKVAPIDKSSIVLTMLLSFVILGEVASTKTIIAGILITIGTFVLIF